MKKLSRYKDIDALKTVSTVMPVATEVVAARHAQFEDFINTLKTGSLATGPPLVKNTAVIQPKEHGS